MSSVDPCNVGQIPRGVFTGHWTWSSTIFGRASVTWCSRGRENTEPIVRGCDDVGAPVLLPFHVHRLEPLIETSMFTFPDACFELADVGPDEAQCSSLANTF